MGRFTALATISAILVFAFAFVSFDGLNQMQQSNELLQRTGLIVRRHMLGDMLHDTINSDLLAARLAKTTGDKRGIETAAKEFEEHAKDFRENVEANLAEVVPADIRVDLDAVFAALKTYITAGKAALTALQGDADSSADVAVFDERFTFLEIAQETLSQKLLKWADDVRASSAETASAAKSWIAAFALLALICSIVTPVYATASLFAPLRRLQRIMQEIAQGRSDIPVPLVDRRNEMGEVARSVDVFRANLLQIRDMTAEQGLRQEAAQRDKQDMLGQLARQFEGRVQSIIHDVDVVAGEMLETAQSMNVITGTTHDRAASAASESRQAADAAQSIATSVEQMSAASQEIAVQISQSTALVKETVGQVSKAEIASAQLRSANAEIGTIVQVIQEITGQINLLALNATIESARAGEAGKGFAVVAAEVKNLASQTSKATEQISEQISHVQHVSQDVVEAFSTIKSSIEKVDHFAAMVAAAAEEQTSTTNAISHSMSASVQGASRVTADIGRVIEASDEASGSASRVLDSARLLSGQSGNLRREVARFLDEIKAA